MFKHFRNENEMKREARAALAAITGLGLVQLTNHDKDTFWWVDGSFKERYRQEDAKVGDYFTDGNNGDTHEVVAVDTDANRLAYRNCDQNPELLFIAMW